MKDVQYKRLGYFIRWVLELTVVWVFVLPETGPWTAFTLTMLTVGTEWFWFVPNDWKKNDAGAD